MNAFTQKPNVDNLVKELTRETKKRKGGLVRSKEIRETVEAGKFVLTPKSVKPNAFTIKPDVSDFTKKLISSESSKRSGINRANQVTTCQPGGTLFNKDKK